MNGEWKAAKCAKKCYLPRTIHPKRAIEPLKEARHEDNFCVPTLVASAAVEGEAASCRFAGVEEPWPREAAGSRFPLNFIPVLAFPWVRTQ